MIFNQKKLTVYSAYSGIGQKMNSIK